MPEKTDVQGWFTLIGAIFGLVTFIIVLATNDQVKGVFTNIAAKAQGK